MTYKFKKMLTLLLVIYALSISSSYGETNNISEAQALSLNPLINLIKDNKAYTKSGHIVNISPVTEPSANNSVVSLWLVNALQYSFSFGYDDIHTKRLDEIHNKYFASSAIDDLITFMQRTRILSAVTNQKHTVISHVQPLGYSFQGLEDGKYTYKADVHLKLEIFNGAEKASEKDYKLSFTIKRSSFKKSAYGMLISDIHS